MCVCVGGAVNRELEFTRYLEYDNQKQKKKEREIIEYDIGPDSVADRICEE